MVVDMVVDMVSVASGLLTVFSVQVAFLGVIVALFFSKAWGPSEKSAFKVFIILFFISVFVMGLTCIYILHITFLGELKWIAAVTDITIVFLIIGSLVITIITKKRK